MDSPAEPIFQSILREKYDLLSRCLVVSPALLIRLKSSDYMRDKVPQIRRLTTADQKAVELLNILDEVPDSQQQSMFSCLLTALRQDGQEHVANIFIPKSDARPMTAEHYRFIFSKQRLICQYLEPLNGLVDELIQRDVFTEADGRSVTNYTENDDMSREVINILLRKPDSAFDKFISALCSTKQEHVASLFGHQTANIPMTDEHRQLLSNKKKELTKYMNPAFDLMDALITYDVLTSDEVTLICRQGRGGVKGGEISKSSYTEISIGLVNIQLRKSDSSFDKFIEALNSTEQQHVVHILTGQGESPLSRVRRLVLRKARDRLINRVDSLHTPLLAKLISSGVLTDVDRERIELHCVNEDRTAELIDIIVRKSQPAYDKFIQALKDSGHRTIAETLEGLELRGQIDPHFLNDTLPEDKNIILEVVRNKMKALVAGKGHEINEITNLMEQNGFAVSEIREGSIHISFRCFSQESLANLRRLCTDKTLAKLFTRVFCREFTEHGLESLALRITDDEFEKLSGTFREMDDRSAISRWKTVNDLPLELLELVLMRTFLKLFNDHYKSHYKTHEAIPHAYSSLAALCCNWWQTMNGWPQSTTKHWFRHKLRLAVQYVCRPFVVSPRLQSSVKVSEVSSVFGVTVCDNRMFVVCEYSNIIHVFALNNKHFTDIKLEKLNRPSDIVSCTETQQLFVAGESRDFTRCVWRVSLDGRQVVEWLEKKTSSSQFDHWTLSVTSRRLLVTSYNNELLLYGADGVELKRVPLPDTMASLQHAVETSHGTFIVCHREPQPRVSEVTVDGHVTRVYCDQQQLPYPVYLSLDSDGRIFVADYWKHGVVLLNNHLELERVLLDAQQHQLTAPWRLCYTQQTRQLAVGTWLSGKRRSYGKWFGCVHLFRVR